MEIAFWLCALIGAGGSLLAIVNQTRGSYVEDMDSWSRNYSRLQSRL